MRTNSESLPDGWTPVGVGTHLGVVAFDPEGRPHSVRDGVFTALDLDEAAPALAEAVAEAARRLWGADWQAPLVETFDLDRRAVQRGRLSERPLRPQVLQALGSFAAYPPESGIAEVARALGRYFNRHGEAMLEQAEGDLHVVIQEILRGRWRPPFDKR